MSNSTRAILIVLGAVVLAASLVIAAFLAGRMTAPGSVTEPVSRAAEAPATQTETGATAAPEQQYTCSMHPQVRSRDPNGKCPTCGMDLIPVPADADDDTDGNVTRLRVSERAAALMRIQTMPARRMNVEREISLYGRIDFDERRLKTIAAWTAGRIDRLSIDFTGQTVLRDQPMLELYSPSLISAQEELLQSLETVNRLQGEGDDSRLAVRTALDTLHATREKLRLLGLDPAFIDELEASRAVREHLVIPAPLDGIVVTRHINLGDYAETGQPLFTIADLSQLWVRLSVFESDLAWLRVGQEAVFTSPSYPGRMFEGTVAFIDLVLDDRTRSVAVRIDLPNEEMLLKPGMFVRGVVKASIQSSGHRDIQGESHEQPLVIPATAPLITGRRALVYVRIPDSDRPTFEPRDVALGPRAGDFYVVREGLEEGDLVVVHGAFKIDSELQIRGRPSMMQPEGGAPPADHDHGASMSTMRPEVRADHPAAQVEPADVADAFALQVHDLFERYLAITTSLAADDPEGARAAVEAMQDHLLSLDLSVLSEAQHHAWLALDVDMLESLRDMRGHGDLAGTRAHLPHLTEQMSLALVKFAGPRAGTVYRAHCPMAFDNRGADWLQRDDQIANPYFGASMFRCGTAERLIGGETGGEAP